jgi:hypothetical protein
MRSEHSSIAPRVGLASPFCMQEDKKPAPAAGEEKPNKPWPMSWIIIAILVYAVIHTLVTLLGN